MTTTTEPTTAALAARADTGSALVTPAAGLDQIAAAMEAYEATKARLLNPGDYQDAGAKSFIKRSGWRKLAIAFGVDLELVSKTITHDERGRVVDAEFVYRAIAPNGRHADGWGNCSADERCCYYGCDRNHGYGDHCPAATGDRCDTKRHFTKPNHDIPATAETRAKNRACADLFGLGEVSAEELDAGAVETTGRNTSRTTEPEQQKINGHTPTCPACGSAVYDNRDENTRREADGKKRMPPWKCRNKDCTGSEGRDGNPQPWISWHDDPVSAGVVPAPANTGSAIPAGRAGWVITEIAKLVGGDTDEALALAADIAPLTGKEPGADPTETEAGAIVATAWLRINWPDPDERAAILDQAGLTSADGSDLIFPAQQEQIAEMTGRVGPA